MDFNSYEERPTRYMQEIVDSLLTPDNKAYVYNGFLDLSKHEFSTEDSWFDLTG